MVVPQTLFGDTISPKAQLASSEPVGIWETEETFAGLLWMIEGTEIHVVGLPYAIGWNNMNEIVRDITYPLSFQVASRDSDGTDPPCAAMVKRIDASSEW
ncbi:unnamed protein product [Cercospora beticola]|nr:unnamed protein product [Cercospora beticola]